MPLLFPSPSARASIRYYSTIKPAPPSPSFRTPKIVPRPQPSALALAFKPPVARKPAGSTTALKMAPQLPALVDPRDPKTPLRHAPLNLAPTPAATQMFLGMPVNTPGPFDQAHVLGTFEDMLELEPEPTHERKWLFFKRKIPLAADPDLPWSKQLPEVKERLYKEAFRRWMGIYVASPFFLYCSWYLFYYGYLGHDPEWDFYKKPWGMDEEETAAWEVRMAAKKKYWAERRAMWDTPVQTVSPAS